MSARIKAALGERDDLKCMAAVKNAKLATAAVLARIAARPKWMCQQCNKSEDATMHRLRNKYCSKACVSAAYQRRMKGAANPNFRAAAAKVCVQCRGHFESYRKGRKFCSASCYRGYYQEGKARRVMPKARFCRGRLDANQAPLMRVFEQLGCKVIDTSILGFGFPDLLISVMGIIVLVEVKNPETAYGRAPLSGHQRDFHARWPCHVVRTQDEAIALVADVRARFRDIPPP